VGGRIVHRLAFLFCVPDMTTSDTLSQAASRQNLLPQRSEVNRDAHS